MSFDQRPCRTGTLPVFDIDRCAGRKEDRSQPRGRMRQQPQLWRYPHMHATVWGLPKWFGLMAPSIIAAGEL